MFTLSSDFACEIQRLTFFTNYLLFHFFASPESYSLPSVFIAPPPKWYISLSLLGYFRGPVIKELSPHSKLTLLFSSLSCWHWGSATTFLLCSLLSVVLPKGDTRGRLWARLEGWRDLLLPVFSCLLYSPSGSCSYLSGDASSPQQLKACWKFSNPCRTNPIMYPQRHQL